MRGRDGSVAVEPVDLPNLRGHTGKDGGGHDQFVHVQEEPATFDWQASGSGDESWRGKSRMWIHDKPGTARALTTTKTLAVYGAATRSVPDCPEDPQPDGPRYAACGDAVTVPVIEWLGRRLMAVLRP